GLSLRQIVMPTLTCAFCLACVNFSIVSGLTPLCTRESKTLGFTETSMNPLLLIQRKDLVKIKDAYLKMETLDFSQVDNFFLIVRNPSQERLQFITAKKLKMNGDKLIGLESTVLTHLKKDKGGFDPLIIENQKEIETDAPILSLALKKHRPLLDPGSMSLWMLQMRAKESGKKGRAAEIEILRRMSLVIAVFSFTLLGAAFGITSGRCQSKKGLFIVLFLSLLVLMTYLGLKVIKKDFTICLIGMLIPHGIILLVSIRKLFSIAKGKT
ncbi:MAG TPA: LptF/LptG family permease, partial [Rhabdochlamydiaceae bacterium]|nr:LptF/LptG family permease [Rhabdochlamydiaceae bacterium]